MCLVFFLAVVQMLANKQRVLGHLQEVRHLTEASCKAFCAQDVHGLLQKLEKWRELTTLSEPPLLLEKGATCRACLKPLHICCFTKVRVAGTSHICLSCK